MPSGSAKSTDLAEIAEIERDAQRLWSGAPTAPVMGEREHMHKQKHAMRQHKNKAMHKRAMHNQAPADAPMAPERIG